MRLYIAEKPSLGKAIADALGGGAARDKFKIALKNGDTVCWAVGHLFELLNPEEIKPEYKTWTTKTLPILPDEWKLKPKQNVKEMLANIKELLKQASEVVNAGDADREGQLLIDEILNQFRYKGKVLRVLITDVNPDAIRKSIGAMRPNEEYIHVSQSAESRQRADWLLGLNMTRLYTVTSARQTGEIVSVGRVQTPTLGLVVARDRAIENFTPTNYYVIKARSAVTGGVFNARWQPSDDAIGLDSEGRVVDPNILLHLQKKLAGKIGRIEKFEKSISKKEPPLPYKLSALQSDASKRYDISPSDSLKILQALYESRYVTYPRSDCSYLPEEMFIDRIETFSAIKGFDVSFSNLSLEKDKKTPAWNTEKVEEHHAIIPTKTVPVNLTEEQRKIYDLVARRFVALLMAAQTFAQKKIEFNVQGEHFAATSKTCIEEGWHKLYVSEKETEEIEDLGGEVDEKIPDSQTGEAVGIQELYQEEKKTTPPSRFTEGSLIDAMNEIHKYVNDSGIKKKLKETSGIGTAATQAKILSILLERSFIVKDKKVLISTPKGRTLIDAVGSELSQPDMTALWEEKLDEIKSGRLLQADFISEVTEKVKQLTGARISENPEKRAQKQPEIDKDTQACPKCQKGKMYARNGKYGKFWACSACGLILSDERGKPQKIEKCPSCGQFTCIRIPDKKSGHIWYCRNQSCKKRYLDNRGKLQEK